MFCLGHVNFIIPLYLVAVIIGMLNLWVQEVMFLRVVGIISGTYRWRRSVTVEICAWDFTSLASIK